ncbi:putative ubiquinol-cytochrome c chaperone/UPF0174 [Lupinus albus]|uniref:Putative ubiquinol-cytochrome c chaperone/UPF0174 n=1 Tax=Lupinus albus TaxID=3870 RepID=A0A6A4P345_LUPAL|nr:putative ubiquinol-cytochrome c chaperone/UPF0174 [Lupinus albus]
MKDLEKIFYGNIVAYDTAMLPEAKQGDLSNVIWKNIFSDDGTSTPDAAALHSVQVYKEAILSGNFMFTSLKQEKISAKESH